MAVALGTLTRPLSGNDALSRARERAALIPDLLVEAQLIANTVAGGWHGRRRRGSGDSFWQFRPYDPDESISRIDWRRSARDDSIYVRDQEWEAAHTIWIWSDNSPSMLYKSSLSSTSKQSRALVLALAITEILAKSGERVGWPGVTAPLTHRTAAERIATELMNIKHQEAISFPPLGALKKRSELIVFSDFLEPIETTIQHVNNAAHQGLRGNLVQIIDPAEESFPFSGRTEFMEPETGTKLTHGRAEALSENYIRLFQARQDTLRQHCKRLGWNHIVHHTDQSASSALISLHLHLSKDMSA